MFVHAVLCSVYCQRKCFFNLFICACIFSLICMIPSGNASALCLSFHSCIQSSTAVDRGTDPRYGYKKGDTFVIYFFSASRTALSWLARSRYNAFKWSDVSWSWSHDSWITTTVPICNQYLSPLKLWVRTPFRRGVLDATLGDKVCQWLDTGRWFSRVLRFPPPIKLTATI